MRIRFASVLLLGIAVSPLALAGDPLLYERRGRDLVITNTPSEHSRPIPGLSRTTLPRTADLPTSRFDPLIAIAAREAGLTAALVKTVAWAESGFDPDAVSPKGAQGLMQLMPETAKERGVSDPFDPAQNLRAGAQHLRAMLDSFDGDLTLALAAYNAGATTVRRHGGVPDYPETRNYVRRIHSRLDTTRTRDARPAPQPQGTVSASAGTLRAVKMSDGTLRIEN